MIWRMMVAVMFSVMVGLGVWQGASHYLAEEAPVEAEAVAVEQIDDNAGPDDGTLESLNARQRVTDQNASTPLATPTLSAAQAYKAKRYGLIVGLITLPFLMLLMLPGGRQKEAK